MNNKLSIQDLISGLAARNGMDSKAAGVFVRTAFEIIEEYISRDKLVKIKGLGTFKLVSVSDRESVNVNTGERILIAGHSKLSFTPDTSLKDAINRPFSDFETTVLNENTSTEDMERIPSAEQAEADMSEESDSYAEDENAEENAEYVDVKSVRSQHDAPEKRYVTEPETDETPTESLPSADEDVQSPVAEENTEEESLPEDTPAEAETDAEPAYIPDTSESSEEQENTDEKQQQATEIPLPVEADEARTVESSQSEENQAYPMAKETIGATATKGHGHAWLYTLLTLFLMAVSYVCGYYHVHELIDISLYPEEESEESPIVKPVEKAAQRNTHSSTNAAGDITEDSIRHDSAGINSPADKPQIRPKQEEDPAEVAKYFPQVPNGSYWIVGDAGHVHLMKVGETLYKVAKEELGDRDLVRYIIAFNRFEDPNIIHTGDTIRIPKLAKKDDASAL